MLRLQTLTWFGLFWFWLGNRTESNPPQCVTGKREIAMVASGSGESCIISHGYTVDRICHALPVVSFAFQNDRLERVANFFLTAFGNQFFKLPLDIASHCERSSGGIFVLRLLCFRLVTARDRYNTGRLLLAVSMQFNNAFHCRDGFL